MLRFNWYPFNNGKQALFFVIMGSEADESVAQDTEVAEDPDESSKDDSPGMKYDALE